MRHPALLALFLLAATAACGTGEPTDSPDPDDDTAPPDTDDPDPSAWPDLPHAAGLHELALPYDERERRALVYLPQGFDPTVSTDVVVVLHGGGGQAESMRGVGFEGRVDAAGGGVIYPEGFENRWNDGRAGTTPARQGIDDVGFLTALLAHARDGYTVRRVAVVGGSNGGMMSYRMGCEAAEHGMGHT